MNASATGGQAGLRQQGRLQGQRHLLYQRASAIFQVRLVSQFVLEPPDRPI